MTLTRDEILFYKRNGPGTPMPEEWQALCDLALSAFDMRERAAKVCDRHAEARRHAAAEEESRRG